MSTTVAHPQSTPMSTSTTTGDDALRKFAYSHTAGELIFNRRKLISVEASIPLSDVLQILSTEQIRAVPVYKKVAGSKQYMGIVSAYDIVSYIAMGVTKAAREEGATPLFTGEVSFSLDRFDKVPVSDLFALDVNLSIENSSLWSLEPTDLLATVIDYFAKGIHRVLVHQRGDKTGKTKYHLLTQTDVLRFLHQNIGELGSVFTTRLEELKMCNPQGLQRKLYGLTVNHSALDAFLLMHREVLHAVPIVNDQGTLVTTLSTADTKGLNRATLPNLMLPVTEFIKKQHEGRLLHPITGKARDTMKDIIVRMLNAEIHRHQVWITDAAEKPIEVVTMTDVLRKVHEQIVRQSPA